MQLIVALMACHNRREKTLAAITCYFACDLLPGFSRKLVMVDDGSIDGTAEAVHAAFPDVLIIAGDGTLFWNRGMLRAWQHALPLQPGYVLWLNDDTLLYPHALVRLLETDARMRVDAGQPGIAVGSTENDRGELSYGGSVPSARLNRLNMRKLVPGAAPQPAMTLNGNCVLVPQEVFNKIGLLDEIFEHAMGDHDYGFRAHKAGIPVWVMPDFAGRCNADHSIEGSFNDRSLPLRVRWKKIMSPRGLPPHSWQVLCRRHAGVLWPLVWAWPYGKLILTSLTREAHKSGQ